MTDLHRILTDHRSKVNQDESLEVRKSEPGSKATSSEIPDIFFDEILNQYKLSRIEIMVLMFLYRMVWCRPNLYRVYGISQLFSYAELAKRIHVQIDEVQSGIRKLEGYGFISTIRPGQYFVRKYFTREYDEKYTQTYDDFEI